MGEGVWDEEAEVKQQVERGENDDGCGGGGGIAVNKSKKREKEGGVSSAKSSMEKKKRKKTKKKQEKQKEQIGDDGEEGGSGGGACGGVDPLQDECAFLAPPECEEHTPVKPGKKARKKHQKARDDIDATARTEREGTDTVTGDHDTPPPETPDKLSATKKRRRATSSNGHTEMQPLESVFEDADAEGGRVRPKRKRGAKKLKADDQDGLADLDQEIAGRPVNATDIVIFASAHDPPTAGRTRDGVSRAVQNIPSPPHLADVTHGVLGMVVPGATVFVIPHAPPKLRKKKSEDDPDVPLKTNRKSTHVLYHALHNDRIVGLHPLTANMLAQPVIESGMVLPMGLPPVERVEKEKTVGPCRYDFVLTHTDGSRTVIEVKNVPHAFNGWDGTRIPKPRKGRKQKAKVSASQEDATDSQESITTEASIALASATYYTTGDDSIAMEAAKAQGLLPGDGKDDKTALFPLGEKYIKKNAIISPRALKHIEDMEQLVKNGEARAMLLYIVQRSDCNKLCVSKGDPTYRLAVIQAAKSGVMLRALSVRWSEDGQHCHLHRWLDIE